MSILKEHVDTFIALLPRDGRTFDAQVNLKKLFLDVSTHLLFGQALGMQDPFRQHESEAFLLTLDSALLGMNKRRQGLNLTSIKLWFDRTYAADVAKVHEFVDGRIRDVLARTRLDTSTEKSNANPDSNQHILAEKMARQVRNPIYLRGALLQCFLPARDQPAILTSNTLFELARHPEHWTRLRPVALALSPDDELSAKKIANLLPIQHVILEALRLHGPGGGNRRIAAQDLVFPEGGGPDGKSPLFVPRGAQIQTHLPVLHRSLEFWGNDADEFRPQRFEEKGGPVQIGWSFKPFLAGPRTCPAKDQVIIQATYILVRLLREFEMIENRDEVWRFVEMARLTTESRRGARIALKPLVLM